jgi:hypothetical protein
MNSFSSVPHQPYELGHLSDEPDVQNDVPLVTFSSIVKGENTALVEKQKSYFEVLV